MKWVENKTFGGWDLELCGHGVAEITFLSDYFYARSDKFFSRSETGVFGSLDDAKAAVVADLLRWHEECLAELRKGEK